jgi:hypothetical protein
MSGSHQRSSASWTSSRCRVGAGNESQHDIATVEMWNDSSQQIFRMIRAYGA